MICMFDFDVIKPEQNILSQIIMGLKKCKISAYMKKTKKVGINTERMIG